MEKEIFERLVKSDIDCDQVCAILCRNGYSVTADEIPYQVTSEINPPKWKIRYFKTN